MFVGEINNAILVHLDHDLEVLGLKDCQPKNFSH
jgi:hypothetical protein